MAQAQFAHEPERFLAAPKGAIERCLEKAGWKVRDVDLFEVNEAFSGIECVRRELDIPEEKFNVNGGAVALGHPIGASGARLLVTLLYALRARSTKFVVSWELRLAECGLPNTCVASSRWCSRIWLSA